MDGILKSSPQSRVKEKIPRHHVMEYVTQHAAIVGATILVPCQCHAVKFLQLIRRLGTRRFRLQGSRSSNELQWLDLKIGHQDRSPSNCHQGDMPHSNMAALSCSIRAWYCACCCKVMLSLGQVVEAGISVAPNLYIYSSMLIKMTDYLMCQASFANVRQFVSNSYRKVYFAWNL